jgi:small subunit ribosomal protein S16
MLKIRLKRVGRKHDPSFRIVVTDSKQGPKSGNYVEMLGSYSPRTGSPQINGSRVSYWLERGVQLSDTVHNIFVDQKLVKGDKRRPIRAARETAEKSAIPSG